MGEAERVGAAVALHHHAVQAEQDGAVVAARVHPLAQPVERRAGEQVAEAGGDGGGEDLAQEVAHQLERALAGLERDVAGEAVGHHHVHRAGGDVVALDEAVELRADVALAQDLGGQAQALVALQLLRADVEQAEGGRGQAEHGAGEDLAHDGELDQVARVALHVGAEVEHHHVAARRGADGGERRPVDLRQRLDHDLGQRHQRAGVAGGDHAGRLARRHGVDRQAHGAVPALPQRGGGLHVGGDGVGRVAQAAQPRGALAQRQHAAEPGLVADEQEARLGMALGRELQPVQHDVGRVVAPHGVDGQGEALRHAQSSSRRMRGARSGQVRTAAFSASPAGTTSRPS